MKIFKSHPEALKATEICRVLQDSGHQAVFAGGCVRDALLGRVPKDFDVATSATPDEVEALFSKTVAVGKAFGVILVVRDEASFEVATFRNDGEYSDGRRPETVEFSSLEEDALRRDFTVNAMYYDPLREKLIDTVQGEKDLKAKILRTVGEPERRFKEDRLRLLRCVRFSCQLNFTIEEKTWDSVLRSAPTIREVSRERITEEIGKILICSDRLLGFYMLESSQLLSHVLPEFEASWRSLLDHEKDLGRSLLHYRGPETDLSVLWAQFFLMLGDDRARSLFKASLARLVLSKYQQKCIEFCLNHVGELFKSQPGLGKKMLWLGGEFGIQLLRIAEAYANKDIEKSKILETLVAHLTNLISKDGKLPESYVSGEDLILLNIKKGPLFGSLLNKVYELQLVGEIKSREQALNYIKTQA